MDWKIVLLCMLMHSWQITSQVMTSTSNVLTSITSQLGAYSHFDLQLKNDLLPSGVTFSLEFNQITTTSYSASSIGIAIYSTNVTYEVNPSRYTIWNYQNIQKTITVNLLYSGNTTVSSLLFTISPSDYTDMFTAILDNDQTSGYMLPFNMQNVKVSRVFVLQHNASLIPKSYNLPPFMSTYWTENKLYSSVMPYLPYFSRCGYELNYLILNDLILNANCKSDIMEHVICQSKEQTFRCIIEEYEVASVSSQYWFNAQNKIVFYLHPLQLPASKIDQMVSNQDYVTSLFNTYYSSLVPVRYTRTSTDPVIVNHFDIILKVDLNYGQHIQIVTADIIGSYDQSISQPYADVVVKVEFISMLLSLIYYNAGLGYYILFVCIYSLLYWMPLRMIHKHLGNIHVGEKFKYMVAPALKGIGYGLLTAGGMTIFVYIISFYTNYSSFTATYDADYSGEALQNNNKGRYGLSMVLIGAYIVMSGIRQASKVNQTEQLKIALEDDKQEFENEEELQEKIQFSKKNQISNRRYVFNGAVFFLFMSFYHLSLSILPSNFYLFIEQLLYPLFFKSIFYILRKYMIKSHLFLCAFMVSMQILPIYTIIRNKNLYELIYLYVAKYFSNLVVMIYFDIFLDWLCKKIYHRRGEHRVMQWLFNKFEKEITNIMEESQYERALSYSVLTVSLTTSTFLYPALGFFIYLTEQYSQIPSLMRVTQPSIIVALMLFLATTAVDLYGLLVTVDFLKKYFDLRIEEAIRFNHFKFMRQKFRWMSDVFAQSKDIREDYRLYQKFAFSSQLYLVITLIAFGLQVMLIGMVTILQVRYLPFQDPVTIPSFIILWIIIEVCSTAVSFAAVKLKLYERKQVDPIRQKLGKIDKYLKKNQIEDYLELAAIKDYFMLYNKNWIIANFDNIFTKQDFRLNNCQLITKYKHYKSAFKRQKIALKKKQQIQKMNSAKMNQRGELFDEKYRIIRDQNVYQISKRISIYWYYLAKQNLFLKEIVNRVKKEQIRDVCEYCKMDVELEVLQKKEFHELTNRYRIQNVGKMFDENSFLEFYRLNQQFITICLQCKQKNLHLESQINSKSKSSKIVFYWLLMARSRLLHPPSTKKKERKDDSLI